jgi:hypothetical protein
MFSKTEFIENFVDYYIDQSDDYDFSIVFDEFIDDFVRENSIETNKQIINLFYETIDFDSINVYDEAADVLYELYYKDAEQAVVDKCESEADTDCDIPTEFFD